LTELTSSLFSSHCKLIPCECRGPNWIVNMSFISHFQVYIRIKNLHGNIVQLFWSTCTSMCLAYLSPETIRIYYSMLFHIFNTVISLSLLITPPTWTAGLASLQQPNRCVLCISPGSDPSYYSLGISTFDHIYRFLPFPFVFWLYKCKLAKLYTCITHMPISYGLENDRQNANVFFKFQMAVM